MSVKPSRGVRQGDPFSPVLFNLVIDQVLKGIATTSGVRIKSARVNQLAYADDVVLLAETERGLQHSIDQFEKGLKDAGLEIKRDNCATIEIDTVPRDRQVVVKSSKAYRCSKGDLSALSVTIFYWGTWGWSWVLVGAESLVSGGWKKRSWQSEKHR